MTPLILYTYQMARTSEIEFIKSRLGKGQISDQDFQRVKEIIEGCGALDRTKKLAQEYYEKAISSIEKLTKSPQQKSLLRMMANLMVGRFG